MELFQNLLPVAPWQLACILLTIAAAYVIFGIAGFGSALVAGPLLAHFLPLSSIIPILALLDFMAATTNLLRDGRTADIAELRRLVPCMFAGSLAGAALLLFGRPDALLLALGLFATAYAIYALSRFQYTGRLPAKTAFPFGLVGGVFSALFGSGGFIYAIYLSNRLADKTQFRVTQTTMIGLSTLTRATLFLLAGVYAQTSLLLLVAMLFPAMLAGVFLGRHITLKLSREQFMTIINSIVLLSGLFLLYRYFSHPTPII